MTVCSLYIHTVPSFWHTFRVRYICPWVRKKSFVTIVMFKNYISLNFSYLPSRHLEYSVWSEESLCCLDMNEQTLEDVGRVPVMNTWARVCGMKPASSFPFSPCSVAALLCAEQSRFSMPQHHHPIRHGPVWGAAGVGSTARSIQSPFQSHNQN